MGLIALFGVFGLVIGALVGYFLSTGVVVVSSILVFLLVWYFFRSQSGGRGTSGGIGVFLMGGSFLIPLMFSMWIAWFSVPHSSGGISMPFDTEALLQFLKRIFLR
jgi:hypothetical protein